MPNKSSKKRKKAAYTNGNAAKVTAAQKRDIEVKIVEAQQAIADIEKEIASEDLDQSTLLPEEVFEGGLRLGFDAEASGKTGVVEGLFNYCPTCADEKIARGRAAEAGQKAETILTIRDIVATFRKDVDGKLNSLSTLIENQLKPIIAMTTAVAIARKDLDLDLAQFEDSLHRTLGLDKFIDPEVVSTSLFGEALKDAVAPEAKPASQGFYTSKDEFGIPGSEFDHMLTDTNEGTNVPLEDALDTDDEAQYRQ